MVKSNIDLPDSFILYLKEELTARNKKNPRYSLRSFARSFHLSSSFLSKLLNGKRALTEDVFNNISSRLALSPEIKAHYHQEEFLSESSKTSSKKAPKLRSQRVNNINENRKLDSTEKSQQDYKKLSMDQFSFIADWYHFAILELHNTKGFIFNSNFIASKLSISVLEAKQAIDRLLQMNLIKVKKTSQGETTFLVDHYTSIDKKIATAATLKQQKAFLEKAIDALIETPIEERSQSSMTMAIPKNRLKEAEQLIHDFRRDFTARMQRKGECDAVYQLSVSFYPLTKEH